MDVSQDVAIKACLDPSANLLNKISRSTKTCLGDDDMFDWEDFSQLNEEQLETIFMVTEFKNAIFVFF